MCLAGAAVDRRLTIRLFSHAVQVDIVYVSNLHPQHRDTANLFMNARKHVLCEKPIALNSFQTSDMIDTAKRNVGRLRSWTWSPEEMHSLKQYASSNVDSSLLSGWWR